MKKIIWHDLLLLNIHCSEADAIVTDLLVDVPIFIFYLLWRENNENYQLTSVDNLK